jgi:hypothetical protein
VARSHHLSPEPEAPELRRDGRGSLAAGPPDGATASDKPFGNHVEQRTIVLHDPRILFLPIPKAGCTSILWLLAELAGIPLERFRQSDLAEPTPALTIHDMSLWPDEFRLGGYEGEERERILAEDGWLRFSLVRDPAPRLWSAWQSKLLLREPRFLATFGEEPWFPRLPQEPAHLVQDFRRFVAAVGAEGAQDVHWSVQHDLAEQLPLGHVGRVERMEETLDLLRAHVGDAAWPPEGERENRTPIPMAPEAYDERAAAALHDRYRADFEAYGYAPPEAGADRDSQAAWEAQVEAMLPMVRVAATRHVRIGQLHDLAQRRKYQARTLARRLDRMRRSRPDVDHATSPILTNLEGDEDFDVRWAWAERELEPGFTAVVRVKNEARSLPWVLPPLFRAVSRVIVVDNGSTDGTPDLARRIAEEVGGSERFELLSYPFSVARCGSEHLGTPASSVHSLAYFYNWSFSHVATDYALKWDGDMVLTEVAVNALRDLAWQVEAREAIVRMPRYPLYVADEQRAFLDIGLSNREAWAWPNRPGYSFVKALEWELPLWAGGTGSDVMSLMLPDWSCLELKHLDADEFDHWSASDFDTTGRTQRKRREWQVFHALADGGEPPRDVFPVEAPAGVHVVDYVRDTWLLAKAPELTGMAERILGRLARLGA